MEGRRRTIIVSSSSVSADVRVRTGQPTLRVVDVIYGTMIYSNQLTIYSLRASCIFDRLGSILAVGGVSCAQSAYRLINRVYLIGHHP